MTKDINISNLSKEELVLQVRDLQQQVSRFEHQIALLQKMVFGSKSEGFKVKEAPDNQLSFGMTTEDALAVISY